MNYRELLAEFGRGTPFCVEHRVLNEGEEGSRDVSRLELRGIVIKVQLRLVKLKYCRALFETLLLKVVCLDINLKSLTTRLLLSDIHAYLRDLM